MSWVLCEKKRLYGGMFYVGDYIVQLHFSYACIKKIALYVFRRVGEGTRAWVARRPIPVELTLGQDGGVVQAVSWSASILLRLALAVFPCLTSQGGQLGSKVSQSPFGHGSFSLPPILSLLDKKVDYVQVSRHPILGSIDSCVP